MLDKFVFSLAQSPQLLKEFFSDTATVVEKYALSSDDVRVLKEMFSSKKNAEQLSLELAGSTLTLGEVGWWPPGFLD